MMISLLLATALTLAPSERINRFCADAIGIPYASDNFTDAEYELFQSCVRFFTKDDHPTTTI